MRARLTAVIETCVADVFGMMVPVPLQFVGSLQAPHTSFTDSVSAQVGFTGSHVGVLSMHCSRSLAARLTAAMLGDDDSQTYPIDEIEDAIGEISNMLGGAVKGAFSAGGLDLTMSVPAVASGDCYEFSAMRDPATVISVYESGCGQVLFGVKLNETRR